MNVMEAFVYGTAGIVNDTQMHHYSQMIQNNYLTVKSYGGVLGESADRHYKEYTDFVDSKAWELSARLTGNSENERVGVWSIGRFRSLAGLQNAQGLMTDYIMSNPEVMQLYQDGILEGYEGRLGNWNTGIGENNLFWRRQQHGMLNIREVEEKQQAHYKHYYDSAHNVGLSVRERFDLAATQHTVNHFLAKTAFDFTSPTNQERKDPNAKD